MSTRRCSLKKRTVTILTTTMMFLTVFAAIPMSDIGKVYAAGETAKVTASLLNVRTGAGTGYSKLGSLSKGTTFTVTGSAKDKSGVKWYKLKFKNKNGYVSSKYVNIISPTVTSVSNLKGTVNTKTDPLTVRSGPGSTYKSLGTIAKGKTFTITGKAKDKSGKYWYRFTFNGKRGYVLSTYIKTKSISTSSSSSSVTVTKVTDTKGTVATKSDPLTVRSGPGSTYKSLGTIAKGKTFTITGKAKDKSGVYWYQFKFNGKTAYVTSKYVTAKKTTSTSSSTTSSVVSFKMGTTTAESGVNVRSGAGTSYSVLTILPYGSLVTVKGSAKDKNGKVWYKYSYSSSKSGYICSDYLTVKTVKSDSSFESYMKSQGFPESYKPGLRLLHAAHPNWVFKAMKVGYSWSDALSKESVVGRNLVSPGAPVSHRSTASGSYNSKTKKWTRFDGSWYAANSKVIAYYMDPRNFLTESGIYQFMTHSYDSKSQNSTTVAAVIKGSFMEGKNPGSGYSSYQSLISAAGKAAKVNPNVIAAMIIQEQGYSGSTLSSGTYTGKKGIYKGYYNFLNVGAYTTSDMSAVERGLWYAKGSGKGATSYSRPWNTRYKSIKGGAQFYYDEYVSRNQDSYYAKKFNVYNGLSSVGSHQYMTFVAAAASEGNLVKKAYENSSYPAVFEIPVYNSMPAYVCPLP